MTNMKRVRGHTPNGVKIMKLSELKQEVYECWTRLSTYRGAIVQPENFKKEVRGYGDLRKKTTWQSAYAAFTAMNMWDSGMTEHTTICYAFNFITEQWNYSLRHQILEQYLAIPGTLEFIMRGLEQIFQSNDSEDKESACGFLSMVGEQSGTAGEFAIRHFRRLTGANTV